MWSTLVRICSCRQLLTYMYHYPLISTGVFDVNDVEARLIVLLYSDKKIIPISSRNKVFFPESQSIRILNSRSFSWQIQKSCKIQGLIESFRKRSFPLPPTHTHTLCRIAVFKLHYHNSLVFKLKWMIQCVFLYKG